MASSLTLWLLGALVLGFCLRALFFPPAAITRHGKPLRRLPGGLPLIGHGLSLLQGRPKLLTWLVECQKQHHLETMEIYVPSLPAGVLISDSRNLDFVFKNEALFRKGDFFRSRSRDLFGDGIINVDGDAWRVQRKAGLRFLGTSTIRTLTEETLPRLLRHSLDSLSSAGEGRVVDLQAELHELTTQLMGEMAYDMEMHADDDFTLAFEYAAGATAERLQNPLWPLTETFTRPGMRRALATVRTRGRQMVAKAVSDGNKPSGTLMRCLLDGIGHQGRVADAALNYLSAGRDTTAQALTWTFYLLMKHADVVTRLRSEAHDEGSSYALAVFYEALRLYPPIPLEIKQAQQDVTLPDGTHLPRNAIVIWCTWAMNRSSTGWGPDAASFRPDRWLSPDGQQLVHRPAAEFPVFHGGQRSCLGRRMAEAMAVQVLTTLVPWLDFRPAYTSEEDRRVSRSGLTLPMEGGLPVYVDCVASSREG
ncbi:cytochrome p450 oxidoreductase [Ophiocordyceps camponoti-floridani]|uniref:Cytochrome p450 oxidoreductase n=1 Tax=Ophiocordyceps camponoti-floridani TaxID=2030778 RepID=A0A8H4QCM1_9HYPO|nr:cytochrome p450 oxidoreductase [Ophiocordyceps camponoti-floridani]